MTGRLVEIAEEGRHLSKFRGFLIVETDGRETGRIPLDDIVSVITTCRKTTFSSGLIVALSSRCIPLVVCDSNFQPAAFLWTVAGHHEQAGRMSDQASASRPLRKRLWAQIVTAKIELQGETLRCVGVPSQQVVALAQKVRSGDPANIEALAARRYWPMLFGADFRRQREAGGVNALLNYSYTVLRAATARSVMAAGLHPSIGIAHRQRGNSFALADDLMEPFRPIADLLVHTLVSEGITELDRSTKSRLARVLITDMLTSAGVSPVNVCLQRLAFSLAQCFADGSRRLDLPARTLPWVR